MAIFFQRYISVASGFYIGIRTLFLYFPSMFYKLRHRCGNTVQLIIIRNHIISGIFRKLLRSLIFLYGLRLLFTHLFICPLGCAVVLQRNPIKGFILYMKYKLCLLVKTKFIGNIDILFFFILVRRWTVLLCHLVQSCPSQTEFPRKLVHGAPFPVFQSHTAYHTVFQSPTFPLLIDKCCCQSVFSSFQTFPFYKRFRFQMFFSPVRGDFPSPFLPDFHAFRKGVNFLVHGKLKI